LHSIALESEPASEPAFVLASGLVEPSGLASFVHAAPASSGQFAAGLSPLQIRTAERCPVQVRRSSRDLRQMAKLATV
jgi:hypothetical protein